jgi:hypothetical protein
MLKTKLLLATLAALVAMSTVAFADDDDQSDDVSSSDSGMTTPDDSSSSESYERPSYYGQAEDSAGDRSVEIAGTAAFNDPAGGEAMKYGWAAYKAASEDDSNKVVDGLRDLVTGDGLKAAASTVMSEAAAGIASDVGVGILQTTDIAPAWSTDDGNHPQYQGTALGDSGMIVEPAEDQTDPDALQVEPVSDDEVLSVAVSSSSQTSTPVPQTTYTPPPSYTPAPTYTPSTPAPVYSSSGGRGVIPAR